MVKKMDERKIKLSILDAIRKSPEMQELLHKMEDLIAATELIPHPDNPPQSKTHRPELSTWQELESIIGSSVFEITKV